MVTILQRSGPTGGIVQHQGILESALQELFGEEAIEKNVRKVFNVRSPHTGSLLECDVWIQRLHLCFEFQDPYHYATTWDANVPLSDVREADSLKGSLARSIGETWIEVPCWWDGSKQSLASTIYFVRPDLKLENVSAPIPLNPPENFFLSIIPDVVELMLASFPPVEFRDQISLENSWWLGEKYDGIRAFWNPRIKRVYSRNNTIFRFPSSFQNAFGKIYLDGELWFGRGQFSGSQKLAFYSTFTEWSLLRFLVFDVPYPTKDLAFEERYAKLLENQHSVFVCVAFRLLCTNGKQLTEILKNLLDGGGEGVIMRKPKSLYEHGRSTNLLKLKASRGDKEALVMKHIPETYSYILQMADGTCFTVKMDESESERQPIYKNGDVVTFTYDNFSRNSIPVNPKILRARKDLSWKEVLLQESKPTQLGETSQKRVGHQQAHGNAQEPRKLRLRKFYESLVRNLGLDPRVPDTWYNLSRSTVMQFKGGPGALAHYTGSLINSFTDIFPDLNLDRNLFAATTQNYWDSMPNRRKFFENYASDHAFDPLVPDNWYSIPVAGLEYRKGGNSIKTLYNGSIISALLHVFPELPWDEAKFDNLRKSYWSEPKNLRNFFVKYAQDHGFDPLVAENWYSVDRGDIIATKLGRTFLGYYDNNLVSILMDVFPDIGLQASKFPITYTDFWQDIGNRRAFFENFAATNNFDPLVAHSWYQIHPNEITTNKDGEKILKYYRGNIAVALRHLFPEIGIEISKVPKSLYYWTYDENKRKFLEKFARRRKFDPLVAENWYNITTQDIQNDHGLGLVEESRFIDTLCHVFPEVKFDKLQFKVLPFKFLSDPKNRRYVMERFAQQQGFDPLIPESWYEVRIKEFSRLAKGGRAVLSYHSESLATTLVDLFPEVNFDVSKFRSAPKDYWNDAGNRKKFFVNFAKNSGFDPLVADSWRDITSYQIHAHGGTRVLMHYSGNLSQALLDLFPDIDWNGQM